jgi:two-component system sensor histidine kinase ChiS
LNPKDYIFVVDNDAPIADLVVEILTDEGYVVLSALSGKEAVTTIEAHEPALLILDMRMPAMSGPEVIRRLITAGHTDLPIIAMTAAPKDAAPLLAHHDIDSVVIKPFDIDELLARVAQYVQPPHTETKRPVLLVKEPSSAS